MFEIDYEFEGVSSYYFDHMAGVEIFYTLQAMPEWQEQDNLVWTKGDHKIELVVVRMDDLTEEEYKEEIVKYPKFCQIKVWDHKFEDLGDIHNFIMDGCEYLSPVAYEKIQSKLRNYHKK